jgi:FlaA1/EpsC-like NDP-sugar epimerase
VANDPATPNRVQRLLFKPTKVPVLFSNKIASTVKDFYQEKYSKGNVALDNFISRLDSDTKIALYPASHLTFSALSESRLREVNIIGMFDIDTKKHGKIVNGIRVYKASKLKEVMPDVILIFTMAYEQEIRDSFHEMGLTSQVVSITQLINGNV